MKEKTSTTTVLATLLAVSSVASAATMVTTTGDARVRFQGSNSTVTVGQLTAVHIEVGSHGTAASDFTSNYVMPFLLPTLGIGQSFGNASLSFSVNEVGNIDSPEAADLYGMDRVDAADTVVVGDYYEGALDGSNTLLQDSILSVATTVGTTTTNASGGTALTAWLNAQYAGGTNAGNYVFLRLNRDADSNEGNERFRIDTADNIISAPIATITFDIIPEPSSALLGFLATGFFFLRRRR